MQFVLRKKIRMIKTVIKVLSNKCRFFVLHRILQKNMQITGHTLFSNGCDIVVDKKSSFYAGHKCSVEKGTLLAAKNGAVLTLGKGVYINRNCTIVAHKSITLADGVTIGPNTCIYDHDHDLHKRGQFVTDDVSIGKNTWIGAGTIILKGVRIGEECVIAAGSIITHDVQDQTIVVQKRVNELTLSR